MIDLFLQILTTYFPKVELEKASVQKCLETGHGWQGWQPWHRAPDDKGGFLCGRMRHDRHQGFARGPEGQKMIIPRCTHRQVGVPGSQKRKQKRRFRQGTKDRDWKRNQTMVWLPHWAQGERSSSSRQLTAQEADKNERKETGLCCRVQGSRHWRETELVWSLALPPLSLQTGIIVLTSHVQKGIRMYFPLHCYK